jgi:hypothetical protein
LNLCRLLRDWLRTEVPVGATAGKMEDSE